MKYVKKKMVSQKPEANLIGKRKYVTVYSKISLAKPFLVLSTDRQDPHLFT